MLLRNRLRRLLLAGLVVVPSAASAVYVSPQDTAIARLATASSNGLEIRATQGVPRILGMDVSIGGATPAARARSFLRLYGDAFQESSPDLALVLDGSFGATGGDDVVSYRQTYKGLPVFGARLRLVMGPNAAGGPSARVYATSSSLLPAVQIGTLPDVPEASAIDIARIQLGRLGRATLGQTKLGIWDPRVSGRASDPHLVWRFALAGDGSVSPARRVFVDANTGAIVHGYDLDYESYVPDDFDLDLETANGNSDTSSACYFFTTDDDFAADALHIEPGFGNDLDVVTARQAALAAASFYFASFGRESWDDDDGSLDLYVHAGVPNGQWTGFCNDLELKTGWVGFDAVTHEFTHGVTTDESDLEYADESGALNESFSDVMAAARDTDWLHDEDKIDGGGAIRSLQNPSGKECGPNNNQSCGQPDKYSNFVSTSGDNGGVHTNSGIPNKAWYLMGHSGPASFNSLTITGFGRAKMARLAYSLILGLPDTATFADARDLAVANASFFALLGQYGFTAQDVCVVRNAWAAVEIGKPDANCDGVEENALDSDHDGVADALDNCPSNANLKQLDLDHDGIGDVCDNDADGDGISDNVDNCLGLSNPSQFDNDQDGRGDACDNDDDNDAVQDNVDNCPYDANPTQFDGNHDGQGDACDPDYDGDGFYTDSDNCNFVANPTQADSDADGVGDACDKCPNVSDNANAYTIPQFPGQQPQPLQPDSDGDGTPDACDNTAFGGMGVRVNAALFNPTKPTKPDGKNNTIDVTGVSGGVAKLPFPPCDPTQIDGPAKGAKLELALTGVDPRVQVSVEDADGRALAKATPGPVGAGAPTMGLRVKPKCGDDLFLVIALGPGFPGSDSFTLLPRLVTPTPGSGNPWTPKAPLGNPAPPVPPDADGDGLVDSIDKCPQVPSPENFDHDGDGVGDACDDCPYAPNPAQLDRGGIGTGSRPNGIGDACECGDVNDDGRVTVTDAVVIQRALLAPPTATMTKPERCDVGGAVGCSLSDVVIIRRALLSPASATILPQCAPARP